MWYNKDATPKYTAKPNKSLAVVIKGPEAKAGFIPTLSKTKGVIVPITEANKTTKNKALDTTVASFIGCPINNTNKNTMVQMIKALNTATKSTLFNLFQLPSSIPSLLARL